MDSSSASDPFFLDWGTSVNVNEDLRRSIRSEIEHIETDINQLQSNVKAEQKNSNQLTKDFAHAKTELMNLSRGATDDRDNSIMNEQIQLRLRDSLMIEIASVVTPSNSPDDKGENAISSSSSEKHGMVDDHDDATSPIPTQESVDYSNERHLGKYLTKCAIDVKGLSKSMKQKKLNLDECQSKLESMEYEINNILAQIERDQKFSNSWSDEVDEKRRELDIELQRMRCAKDAIQRARKLNGSHAQRLANDSKVLSTNKAQNADTESQYEAERKTVDDELRQDSSILSSMVEKDSVLSSQIESLQKQLKERDEIATQRIRSKQLYEEKLKHITIAQNKEEELKQQFVQLMELLHEKQIVLEDWNKQKVEIEDKKSTNDKEENTTIAQSKSCYPKLLEEKENLAKEITVLHDRAATAKQASETKKKTNVSTISNLNLQYEEKVGHLEEGRNQLTNIKDQIENIHVLTIKEIDENEKLATNLNEAIKAQNRINNDKLEHREKVRKIKLTWTATLEHKSYELEVLKKGAEIITNTNEMEREISNSTADEKCHFDGDQPLYL